METLELSDDEIHGDDLSDMENEAREEHGDETEEAQEAQKVDPETSKKRVVRNPQPKLNTERLKSNKGVHTLEHYFKSFKYHGKRHEREDLDRIMKRIEHWAHRLFPKYDFDDFLDRVEQLGTKKDMQVFLTKYRQDMLSDEVEVLRDSESEKEEEQSAPFDDFDRMIVEQIEKQKTTSDNYGDSQNTIVIENKKKEELSSEVKEKIEKNRQMAIQRRMEKMRQAEKDAKRKKIEEDNEVTIVSQEVSIVEKESKMQVDKSIVFVSQEIESEEKEKTKNNDNEAHKERNESEEKLEDNKHEENQNITCNEVKRNINEEELQEQIARKRQLAIQKRLESQKWVDEIANRGLAIPKANQNHNESIPSVGKPLIISNIPVHLKNLKIISDSRKVNKQE